MFKNFNKQNLIGITVIVVLVAVGVYYLGNRKSNIKIVTPLPSANNYKQLNSIQNNVYDYSEAPNHLGESATVQGKVIKVVQSKGGTIFFNYCYYDYKNCPFSAVIFTSAVKNFNNPFQYEGQTISVSGLIKNYHGRAEIILNSPNQITK